MGGDDDAAPKAAPKASASKLSRLKCQEGPGKGTYFLQEEDVNPKRRLPTNCYCCCAFMAAIIVMVYMNGQNAKKAHPMKIMHPLDHAGNACGLGDFADYPVVYFPAKKMHNVGGPLAADVYYSNPKNLWSVCTKECPTTFTRVDRPGACKEMGAVEPDFKIKTVESMSGESSPGIEGNDTEATLVSSLIQRVKKKNKNKDEPERLTEEDEEVVSPSGSNLTASHRHGGNYSNTGAVKPAVPTCTWYSEMPAKLFLGRYCILGNSLMNHVPDQTGVVCQSAQRAISDVQDEAFQSLDNMANSTQTYLNYIDETIPEVRVDPEMKQMLMRLENDTFVRADTYKKAVQNVGANSTEREMKKVCHDALGQQKSFLADFIADVMNSWSVLLVCMVVGLYTGGMYLLLICFFVKPIVWGSLFACIIGFGVGGWLFWDDAIKVADTGLTAAPASEEKILAVLCWICCGLCLVIVCACRRALNLAIAISAATSSFLMKNSGIMVMPQLLSVGQIFFILYWLYGLSGILSTATVHPANDMTQEMDRYEIDATMKWKILYHFFVGFWVHGFLEGLGTVATAITVTEWYYKPKVNGNKPSSHFSFCGALAKAIFFHSGSIAFGSLIIAVVHCLRVILEWYEWSVKRAANEKTAKCLLYCCKCCLNLATKVLKFISYNSYLMVGITGKGYLQSAYEAYGVVIRNPRRFIILHGVMWTVNCIGRLIIMGITLLVGALLMNKTIFPSMSTNVHSPWPILMVILIIGYMVAGLVFGVFTTSGASLFYNFVCDEEVCTHSGGDYKNHAPGDLGKILEEEAMRRKRTDKPDEKTPDEESPEESHDVPEDEAEATNKSHAP